MADQVTDEEKVKQAFSDVETPKGADETAKDESTGTDEDKGSQPADESTKEEKSTDEDDAAKSLTKPYPWLKGDTPEEWLPQLVKSYENSSEQALSFKKQNDDNSAAIEEAKRIIAQSQGQKQDENQTASGNATLDVNTLPEVQQMRQLINAQWVDQFGIFAKDFPQAREQSEFDKFEKLLPVAGQAASALHGRVPTPMETFNVAADMLKWSPTKDTSKRDNAIKETAASPQVTGSQQSSAKRTQITEQQLAVARRLTPNKPDGTPYTDEELIKDLEQHL